MAFDRAGFAISSFYFLYPVQLSGVIPFPNSSTSLNHYAHLDRRFGVVPHQVNQIPRFHVGLVRS